MQRVQWGVHVRYPKLIAKLDDYCNMSACHSVRTNLSGHLQHCTPPDPLEHEAHACAHMSAVLCILRTSIFHLDAGEEKISDHFGTPASTITLPASAMQHTQSYYKAK